MRLLQGFDLSLCLKFFSLRGLGCLIFVNLLFLVIGSCKIEYEHNSNLIFQ